MELKRFSICFLSARTDTAPAAGPRSRGQDASPVARRIGLDPTTSRKESGPSETHTSTQTNRNCLDTSSGNRLGKNSEGKGGEDVKGCWVYELMSLEIPAARENHCLFSNCQHTHLTSDSRRFLGLLALP
jgi:hypothetical protein